MSVSHLPLTPTSRARERRERVRHLAEDQRHLTAEAFFDAFDWTPSSFDPRRLTAEQFLRTL